MIYLNKIDKFHFMVMFHQNDKSLSIWFSFMVSSSSNIYSWTATFIIMLILRLSLFLLVRFYTCPGGWGWVGQIKINDHLSPIEIETRTELGNNTNHSLTSRCFGLQAWADNCVTPNNIFWFCKIFNQNILMPYSHHWVSRLSQ